MSDIFKWLSLIRKNTISSLFRDTGCAFKFGGDLAQSCSNAVYAGAQETLLDSPVLIDAEEGQLMQDASLLTILFAPTGAIPAGRARDTSCAEGDWRGPRHRTSVRRSDRSARTDTTATARD